MVKDGNLLITNYIKTNKLKIMNQKLVILMAIFYLSRVSYKGL